MNTIIPLQAIQSIPLLALRTLQSVDSRVDVFDRIFLVFLGLGTLVGVVVVAYTMYNAYKYRDDGDVSPDEDRPTLGELPTGGGGGKKLFLSFGISAIIVLSLIIWTYTMLLYVEAGPDQQAEESLEVEVHGFAFGWDFYYPDGVESTGEMVIPADSEIKITVTSDDVWHAFGVPDQRVKADAIPGENDSTWFMAKEEGDYTIECFELCGPGHSGMEADMTVVSQEEFDEWHEDQRTVTVSLEDADGESVTDGVELSLTSQDGETVATATGDDFEDGTVEMTVEQGDTYTLTVESTDGSFDTVENEVEIVDGPEETIQLEQSNDDNDTDTNDSDGGDD